MSTFLERLIEEEEELSIKVGKLKDFIEGSSLYRKLEDIQKVLLCTQFHTMTMYLNILNERIYYINKADETV
jgi:hypothetical protein